ncbi:methylmalonyl Co-A mutase-associated GTPase MeaB [Croceiramulus getboli]|nr:methylmalonyl Co-A mutase-associated GTPase MeaB [Flavobacteriaceae bacterium YJPT1-3]
MSERIEPLSTSSSSHLNKQAAEQLGSSRQQALNMPQLTERLLQGEIAALSQGITLIESTRQSHKELAEKLIEACLPSSGNSFRLGITGVPGVGKSTFIEALGLLAVAKGHKVAVLAVDPSSTQSGGSILGDKTRMAQLSTHPKAYIRPSASGQSLGGVARKTREAIMLCEAAGFDFIIVETVGVGQSETVVHSMVDFFLLLKLSGAGDELQGIKRGIIEMADAIAINKADGDRVQAAQEAKSAFAKALHLYPPKESSWQPKVVTCSALQHTGIEELYSLLSNYREQMEANGFFVEKRKEQNKYWLLQTIDQQLGQQFYDHPKVKKALPKVLEAVSQQELSPFRAANQLLALLH